jgi:hypothetical protein
MTELGQTTDPKALIPGNAASIYQTEAELRQYGDLLHEAGAGLKRIDTSDGWKGAAADAFRAAYHGQPTKWLQAGDAFHEAADALNSYAATLIWSQNQAVDAINQWHAGDKQGAGSTLSNARSQLASAGDEAARRVGQARDLAPPKPGFWSQLGDDIGSFFSGAGHVLETAGETVLDAAASLANAAVHDLGSVAEVVGGLALMDVAAGGEFLGGALDITGAGAVLGVPINVLAAGIGATGIGMAGMGLKTIINDAAGPDRVNMSSQGSGGGGSNVGASNRIRPPQEGDREYVVDNPSDLSETITDIDHIENGTLWEEKTATGQDPRMDVGRWTQKNVNGKLDSYVRARQYMPGYENAPLGLDFTQPGATPQFKAAVEQAVDAWKADHPGVDVQVRWAS